MGSSLGTYKETNEGKKIRLKPRKAYEISKQFLLKNQLIFILIFCVIKILKTQTKEYFIWVITNVYSKRIL